MGAVYSTSWRAMRVFVDCPGPDARTAVAWPALRGIPSSVVQNAAMRASSNRPNKRTLLTCPEASRALHRSATGMCRRINSYRLVTSEFPICRTVRFCRVRAESFNLVGFIGLKISLEPVPVCRISLGAFVGENVRGDPVEEPPIVGDDNGASWKLKKRVFEAGEGFDVEVVGRFVEKQHVAALLKRERKVKAIAFTAGEHTRWLLLIWTLKPKRGHVRSAWYLGFTDLDVVKTVGDHFPECFLWVDATTSLVDIGQLDGLPDFKFAAIEFF